MGVNGELGEADWSEVVLTISLGLIFDIGENKRYRWSDTDAGKGYTQGITVHYKTLDCLRNTVDIIITQADKGGEVVVMKTRDYSIEKQWSC